MKKLLVFCTGASGSGKSTFIDNYLSGENWHNLKSATTRPMREGESDCNKYYFRDEEYFDSHFFATKLFVNEKFWQPGQPKWLYGVPVFEVFDNIGLNFTYNVIEPKYVRQMIDWFNKQGLNRYYKFKILWFRPCVNSQDIVELRQNMPYDALVRKNNTCDNKDFENVCLRPDFVIKRVFPDGYHIYPYLKPNDSYSVTGLLRRLNIRQK